MYHTVKLFLDFGGIRNRKRSGRPRGVRTAQIINAVRSGSTEILSGNKKNHGSGNGYAPWTTSRIIKQDLGLRAFIRQTWQCLTVGLKENRDKSRRLFSLYGKDRYKEILFIDEIIFTLEETFNKQNDRVYAHSSTEFRDLMPRIEWDHYPASVMVWWGGFASLRFL